jgi:dolichol-phosphate mannosyltransferase
MPAYNERANLESTVPATLDALAAITPSHELVVVDDGSQDGSVDLLKKLQHDCPRLRVIRHRRNLGKSQALTSGFEAASGDVVVLIDADGQDDPTEIKRLIDALDDGADLVTGRRKERNDRFIKRRTSQLYNAVTARFTGVPGRDFNSGLKAMRRPVAEALDLYGEMHRYIPVLAVWAGFSITEIDVEHHARLHGESKYGIARFWRGLFDLLTVKFLTTYTARPFHLFGGLSIFLGAIGTFLLIWMGVDKVILGQHLTNRPVLLIGVLFEVVAVQLLSLGLLAELVVHLRRSKRARVAEEITIEA